MLLALQEKGRGAGKGERGGTRTAKNYEGLMKKIKGFRSPQGGVSCWGQE